MLVNVIALDWNYTDYAYTPPKKEKKLFKIK